MNSPSHSIIDSIDSTVDIPVERDEMVEKAVSKYIFGFYGFTKIHDSVEKLKSQVPLLAPTQIDLVLQRLLQMPYKYRPYRHSADISMYISALMQKSYDAGHNGFVLHTHDVQLHHLCADIQGSKERNVDMTVYGDTGSLTGEDSKWCSVRQMGNAYLNYFIGCEHIDVFISGSVSENPLCVSTDVTFRTTNQETFDYVRELAHVYSWPEDRHLLLLDPAGKTLDSWNDSKEEAVK